MKMCPLLFCLFSLCYSFLCAAASSALNTLHFFFPISLLFLLFNSMDSGTFPRVNSKLLPQYSGRQITLFGEVLNCSGDSCFIRASDGGEVQVQLPPGESLESKFVQIVGKVENQSGILSVSAFNVTAAGNNFDMENYDKLVELANGKFIHLFQ